MQTLRKQPSENRLYEMKFDALLGPGVTVASITSFTCVPSTGITLVGGATFAGKSVFQRISTGTLGVSYKFTGVIVDSAGNTVEGEGRLAIINEGA